MRVELLSYTANPERLCCAAAKLTHEPEERDFIEMMNNTSEDHIDKILKHILKLGHESIIEHASFTFYIEGVSRALTHQLVRHRVASYSQQSQRYVSLQNFAYVVPPKIQEKPELKKKFDELMTAIAQEYEKFQEEVPTEDARAVLPNACTTKIVVTMNARELRHFFELRCHKTAQSEIRELAFKMLELASEATPIFFADLEFE